MGKLHAAMFVLLLLLLAPLLSGTRGTDSELDLDRLVSDDRRVREASAAHLRSVLTSRTAESLVGRFESFSPALRGALISLLGKGGPWMPGVVRALGRSDGAKPFVRRILHAALLTRPRSDDPLPLLDELQIFGEGVDLRPRGTWPGAVGLGEFLDWINFEANPSHHFVLDPCLAEREIAPIERPPPAGPARMVIDFVLGQRGLGVRRLETVLLVTEGGRSCHGLSAHDEEYDLILVDRIVDTLAARPRSAASRKSSIEALAALGIPGLFDGYLTENAERAGRRERDDGLDYLLTSAPLGRCAMRMDAAGDESAVVALLQAFDETGPGPRMRALIRLVRLLTEDLRGRAFSVVGSPSVLLRALCDTNWNDEERLAFVSQHLQSPESTKRQAALHAALPRLHRSPSLAKALLHGVSQWDGVDPRTEALLDRCVAAMGAQCGDDDLARLIRGRSGVRGAIEAAAIGGGSSCLAAMIEELSQGGDRSLSLVEAIRSVCERLKIDPLEVVLSFESPLPRVAAAGLQLACAADRSVCVSAAAVLVDEIVTGGRFLKEAVQLLSLAKAGSIDEDLAPLLDAVSAGRIGWPRGLSEAIIRSALDASRDDSTAAARLRLSLKEPPGGAIDPLLDRALKNLSAARKIGSFTIDLRID